MSLNCGAYTCVNAGVAELGCLPPTGLCYLQKSSGRSSTKPTRVLVSAIDFSEIWQNNKIWEMFWCLNILIFSFWFPRAFSFLLCLTFKILIKFFCLISAASASSVLRPDVIRSVILLTIYFIAFSSDHVISLHTRLSFCYERDSPVNTSAESSQIPSFVFSLLSTCFCNSLKGNLSWYLQLTYPGGAAYVH